MTILAVDVQYCNSRAIVAGVSFTHWQDATAQEIHISTLETVADYEPGQFYKRELPCILHLLQEHHLEPDIIVIDGYVFLDGDKRPGLGWYLYEALHRKVVVVGVAKKPFAGIPETFALFRGDSSKPLYVTAAGVELEVAKRWIAGMSGRHRIPTLLKMADRASRTNSCRETGF